MSNPRYLHGSQLKREKEKMNQRRNQKLLRLLQKYQQRAMWLAVAELSQADQHLLQQQHLPAHLHHQPLDVLQLVAAHEQSKTCKAIAAMDTHMTMNQTTKTQTCLLGVKSLALP
jgi:hypothetical protein